MTAPRFAEDTDHGRFYFHPANRRQVPSITNIKGQKNIKALIGATAKECAAYASANREKLATLDEGEAFSLVRGAPFRHDSKKNVASRNGDIVHQWIDMHIQGEQVNPLVYMDQNTGEEKPSTTTARHMWNVFLDFERYYKPRWLLSEFTVWSDSIGYAGTMDWAAEINGMLVLGDNKTGNWVYPDTAMQLAAGAKADFMLDAEGQEVELPKFDAFGILHIRPRFWEFPQYSNEAVDAWFEAFKGLKVVLDTVINWEDRTIIYGPKHQVRQPQTPKPGRARSTADTGRV